MCGTGRLTPSLAALAAQVRALRVDHLQAVTRITIYGRDERFESTIYDVQQKSGFKNIILERKLQVVDESLEKKEAQLSEVLAAANLDPNMLGTVSKKLDDVLDAKNSAIKDLQYELARVTKAHNDVIRVYESKLTEFGIPVEELGFRPLVTKTSTMAAGLVVQ